MKDKIVIRRSKSVEHITSNGNTCIGSVWIGLSEPRQIYFTATTVLTPDWMRLIADAMGAYLITELNK